MSRLPKRRQRRLRRSHTRIAAGPLIYFGLRIRQHQRIRLIFPISGLLAGAGRGREAGKSAVHTAWELTKFAILAHTRERYATARDRVESEF